MNAIDFYNVTCETLSDMARMHGVEDLEKYYSLTDFLAFPQLNQLGEIEQAYMQLAFHAQNATRISDIIKFDRNYRSVKAVLCDFSPQAVLDTYRADSREASVQLMIAAFAEQGIRSNTEKSAKRPNAILSRYANALLDAAEYLSRFSTKNEVIQDLQAHSANTKELVGYFRTQITHGFSVALTCDFLKEFSDAFNNLPKPDVHIIDTMRGLYEREPKYYDFDRGAYRCIEDVQALTQEINCHLQENGQSPITVYQLDRMIWLICSNNFFLDNGYKSTKQWYLSKLS